MIPIMIIEDAYNGYRRYPIMVIEDTYNDNRIYPIIYYLSSRKKSDLLHLFYEN